MSNKFVFLLGLFVSIFIQSCDENKIQKNGSTEEKVSKEISTKKDIVSDTRNNETEEVFSLFLERFNADCSFQKERVQFPLEVISLMEFETNDYDTSYLSKAEYECMEFTEPKSNIADGNVNLKFKNQKDIVFITVGVEDTGIHIQYKFKLVYKKWRLVGIKDEST